MTLAILALAVAPIPGAGRVLSAQQAPDFSGMWTLGLYMGSVGGGASGGRAARGGSGGGGTGGSVSVMGSGARQTPVGPSIVIRQTAAAVTIEEDIDDAMRRTVYALDGTESVNVHGSVTLRTRSRWEDGRLVTEGTQTVSTGQAEVRAAFKEVRWVTDEGTLVIEATRQIEGRDARTSRAEYTKGRPATP
jgi:hypothetical protein